MMPFNLNQQQYQAVHHTEGPMLVIAGAGSGKTRVVTERIRRLIQQGAPPHRILAVTFTNKAAEEMQRRVGQDGVSSVYTCTFHSLGAKILRESIHRLGYRTDFTIYDEDDSEKLFKECAARVGFKGEKEKVAIARSVVSHAKNHLIAPEELAKESPDVAPVYARYQSMLQQAEAVDFDDLLYLPSRLLATHPDLLASYQQRWLFISIDEYQDTNYAQHALIKQLSAQHRNVFAVGDPDQSIYSWRGADVGNILNFERDFPGARVVMLEQNYRSSSNILNGANSLIHNNRGRYKKNLWSASGPGHKISLYTALTDRAEAEFVARELARHPLDTCAILYRTNFQSRVLEDAFLRHQIPYTIIGGLSFYQRKEIKDLLSMLRFAQNGVDAVAFARTINIPKRGIGDKGVEALQAGATQAELTLLDYCRQVGAGMAPQPHRKWKEIHDYVAMIDALRSRVQAGAPLPDIVSEAITRSSYEKYLDEDPETSRERKENIAELVAKATSWYDDHEGGTLGQFLEELTLYTAIDRAPVASGAVRLMTLHHAKGLEFPVVFMVGMEEGIFPYSHADDPMAKLEEERRLCYVGMTRAEKQLYMTDAQSRFVWGRVQAMRRSRFIDEIPSIYTEFRK